LLNIDNKISPFLRCGRVVWHAYCRWVASYCDRAGCVDSCAGRWNVRTVMSSSRSANTSCLLVGRWSAASPRLQRAAPCRCLPVRYD